MDKISVIVPIYNSERTIKKCIECLLHQSYKNLEIILVNDGSTDKTDEIIKSMNLDNKKIIYLSQKNSGVSRARNYGIEKATGEYIFFLDSDDIIDKNVISDLANNNLKNEELVSVKHKVIYNNCEINDKFLDKCYEKNDYIFKILSGKELGVVWGYLFKTSVLKRIKFDENTGYLEDTLLLINYLKEAKIDYIKYIDKGNYYYYIINENSVTCKAKNILKKCKDFIYTLDKINLITDRKYENLIDNKKIIMLEKEMRLVDTKEEYKKICECIKIKKYSGKSIVLKYFSYIYSHNKTRSLKKYYEKRNMIKKCFYGFKR